MSVPNISVKYNSLFTGVSLSLYKYLKSKTGTEAALNEKTSESL